MKTTTPLLRHPAAEDFARALAQVKQDLRARVEYHADRDGLHLATLAAVLVAADFADWLVEWDSTAKDHLLFHIQTAGTPTQVM